MQKLTATPALECEPVLPSYESMSLLKPIKSGEWLFVVVVVVLFSMNQRAVVPWLSPAEFELIVFLH